MFIAWSSSEATDQTDWLQEEFTKQRHGCYVWMHVHSCGSPLLGSVWRSHGKVQSVLNLQQQLTSQEHRGQCDCLMYCRERSSWDPSREDAGFWPDPSRTLNLMKTVRACCAACKVTVKHGSESNTCRRQSSFYTRLRCNGLYRSLERWHIFHNHF